MSLKINVKSGERLLINGSVVVNAGRDTSLVFETPTCFLLERDVMTLEEADTPAKRIYLVLQMLYIFPEGDPSRVKIFEELLTQFVKAAPSSVEIATKIADAAKEKRFFKALKSCKDLMKLEEERLQNGSN